MAYVHIFMQRKAESLNSKTRNQLIEEASNKTEEA